MSPPRRVALIRVFPDKSFVIVFTEAVIVIVTAPSTTSSSCRRIDSLAHDAPSIQRRLSEGKMLS